MPTAQRPLTVRAFEMLGIAILALDLVLVYGVDWSDMIWVPFMLFLILSVTRNGKAVARWVFSALYALGLMLTLYLFARGLMPPLDAMSTGWIMTGASLVQFALLWSPPMSRWIDSKREPELPLGTRPCRALGSPKS